MDGLSGKFADVGHNTVAVGKAQFLCKLRNNRIDMADHSLIFRRDLSGGGEMLLWDNEEVHRCKRADILEGIAKVVLVDLCGRDLTRNDFTEQAIGHSQFLLSLLH